MNKNGIFIKLMGFFVLCLIFGSCAIISFNEQQKNSDFINTWDILEQTTPIKLPVGTRLTRRITKTDTHLFISDVSYRTAVKLFKIESLEQGINYRITIKSIRRASGFRGFILIPKIEIYDNDFNSQSVRQISGKIVPSGMIDPVSFLSEFTFMPDKSGPYYILLSADMTSQHGITLRLVDQYGIRINDITFDRTPYARFRIRIESYE